ncbi:YheC/YheD family protein [Ammoniphilus sp. CFH 90114]|uniref:YheC/YheD family protein n=1 Tax=Ammoniphilus sp. CFH 90114 TaxID=2493665 RepID=UPI00100E2ABE|nr:YheC/YheD family protein [Ammoniphilus sp. CFH 90114]RXT06468.1 YheC/YheD family protein [Ammoniphilus sp. CFH 90114]
MFTIPGARRVADKWSKTNALLSDGRVTKYIPETKKYNKSCLQEMLTKYRRVVLKPSIGTGGNGLIQVLRDGKQFRYFYQQKIINFSKFNSLILEIDKVRKGRIYIVQRGIELATIYGRPIDYRVKIQKPEQAWIITGMVGRLAPKGSFVTNLCRGGDQLTLRDGILRSFTKVDFKKKRLELRKITKLCTTILEKKYPGVRQLGFDFGIDKSKDIWIFEVNTKPH